MWRIISASEERERLKAEASELMANPAGFGAAMRRVIREWPSSCEHNLTCRAINRRAWLGHAGTCLATTAPEEITRTAWHTLTSAQQEAADAIALEVIAEWENAYVSSLPASPAFAKARR
jgi:hypothetical protein